MQSFTPMKPLFRPLSLLTALSCLLTACSGSSSNWRIQLKNGSEYSATSQPQYQDKTGYYRYRNLYGKDALLRAEEVLHIERL
jgi:hypothetical protein